MVIKKRVKLLYQKLKLPSKIEAWFRHSSFAILTYKN